MKNLFTHLLCFFVCTTLFGRTTYKDTLSTGCDTLVTIEGRVLFIKIKKETSTNLQFFLCADSSQKVYSMRKDQVSSLNRASASKPLDLTPDTISNSGKNYAISDTCDLITLSDGKQHYIRILDQDRYNYFYMICGDVEGRVYMMSFKKVKSIKRAPKRPDGTPGHQTFGGAGCLFAIAAVALGLLAVYFIAFLFSI